MLKNELSPYEQHCAISLLEIEKQGADDQIHQLTQEWVNQVYKYKYPYHFEVLGRPIIQFPQDIVAFQEIVWNVKPDLIIETGIAHGGSLLLSASMLTLLDYCDAVENDLSLDPKNSNRRVIGVDIDIRKHNRSAIEAHPMAHRIEMFEGSSVDPSIVAAIKSRVKPTDRVLLCLDSNHTHEHVLAELRAYSSLVSPGSYCIVFDTCIENMPINFFPDRPWDVGDNPMTAVEIFLKENSDFEIDQTIHNKLLITVAPNGFLRKK